jgi:hypothetical protein
LICLADLFLVLERSDAEISVVIRLGVKFLLRSHVVRDEELKNVACKYVVACGCGK